MELCTFLCCIFLRCGGFLLLLIGGCGVGTDPYTVCGHPVNASDRPQKTPANTTTKGKGMTNEQGTPEKRVQIHNMIPKGGTWIWPYHNVVDTPEVKLGDRVTIENFGWKAIGVVTRWDEDGITIREEPPDPDPCATCRIRDQWCCDPWETPTDHQGDDQ